jgi:hypothetical protein
MPCYATMPPGEVTLPGAMGCVPRVDDDNRAGHIDRGDHDSSQMRQQLGKFNTTYR